MTYVRNGWGLVRSQFPSVIILFLYQLLWGLFLYRLVSSAVTAVLSRYPESPPNQLNRILYLIEGQFELKHNPAIHQYFWLLLGMVVLRLLLTPLLQAGILYSLVPADARASGFPLFRGMKEFWKPVTLFFLLELALLALPGFWLVPELYALALRLIPAGDRLVPILIICGVILGWAAYGWLMRQLLLFAQFGYLFKTGVWGSLMVSLKYLLPGIAISLILGASGAALFLLFGTVSWIWTGLLALILQQSYPFFRSLFQIWTLTSQYQLWHTKTQKS
ncbi:hypothetical protein DFP94_11756 [Fontibacillus phaseoli]|uniref:Uncharacterized protein n=1 Tax=Fontibacillus phaseoli TaxID=1416533 RepID=A0A369B1J8_9BACL|nr:hypothetical protein [Fontibacillus phaseoli]RCX14448.1 hypothetical protein DFP94_11756 [Fontibacillus phaseoli]